MTSPPKSAKLLFLGDGDSKGDVDLNLLDGGSYQPRRLEFEQDGTYMVKSLSLIEEPSSPLSATNKRYVQNLVQSLAMDLEETRGKVIAQETKTKALEKSIGELEKQTETFEKERKELDETLLEFKSLMEGFINDIDKALNEEITPKLAKMEIEQQMIPEMWLNLQGKDTVLQDLDERVCMLKDESTFHSKQITEIEKTFDLFRTDLAARTRLAMELGEMTNDNLTRIKAATSSLKDVADKVRVLEQ